MAKYMKCSQRELLQYNSYAHSYTQEFTGESETDSEAYVKECASWFESSWEGLVKTEMMVCGVVVKEFSMLAEVRWREGLSSLLCANFLH